MDSGVAIRPIEDFSAYRQRLSEFVYNSAFLMKPIFSQAKTDPKRIAYAEGEDQRVLRAVQIVVDEGLAKPILVGRTAVIEDNIRKLGLRLQHGVNIEIVDQSLLHPLRRKSLLLARFALGLYQHHHGFNQLARLLVLQLRCLLQLA